MVNKLGVYIASHGNPAFLRSCLAQLLLQVRQPDMVAIHDTSVGSYWALEDFKWLLPRFRYYHSAPNTLRHPQFHALPLAALVDADCDLYTKWDHDDIFFTNHLTTLEREMSHTTCDCVVNTTADVLEATPEHRFNRVQDIAWTWNPTLGMSDNVMFNKRFAADLLASMRDPANSGVPDDVLMGRLIPRSVSYFASPTTTCYVAHGANYSGLLMNNPQYRAQKLKEGK